MFAKVAFPISNFQTFTYSVPLKLRKSVEVGTRIIAPLRGKTIQGIVVKVENKSRFKGEIKNIKSLVDNRKVVTKELWNLILWISQYYLCPIGKVAKTVFPNQLTTNYRPTKYWFVQLKLIDESFNFKRLKKRAPNQYKIINILKDKASEVQVSSFKSVIKNPLQVCKALEKKNIVKLFRKVSLSDSITLSFKSINKKIIFNNEQKQSLKKINKSLDNKAFAPYLLHGVTGSGKTEIYIDAVKNCITQDKTAIILLPEISLTPQIAGRFRSVFGDIVALWHSKLNQSQRAWTWKEICMGTFKVVIGARSAIFSPLKRIGLIVIDEEQENSFMQDSISPRYHARDVGLMRAKKNNAVVILSSATPSLESFYNQKKNKLQYLRLTERYGGAKQPKIHLVDMVSDQQDSGKYGQVVSSLLQNKIEERLINKEQVILLQNRRGHSPIIKCSDCGKISTCPHCQVAVSYHSNSDMLLCHFCGFYERKSSKECAFCQSESIVYTGTGTQKVEEYIKKTFPSASLARLDTDSINSGEKVSSILNSFNNAEIDILLGTQMIAKGLDFPNTTLVGIINADLGLYLPDFRSEEKIFQLIYQAAGRSGRSNKRGEVVIQTYSIDNPVIKYASELNISEFYNKMLNERKELNYPPYSWLAKIEIHGSDKKSVFNFSKSISKSIRATYDGLNILGPAPCYLEKLRNKYRFQIVFKSNKKKDKNGRKIHLFIEQINKDLKKIHNPRNCKVKIHFDPVSLI